MRAGRISRRLLELETYRLMAQRLASLSERVSRTSALLRTRVDIATGALIPLVLWGVWRTSRRIHEKIRTP